MRLAAALCLLSSPAFAGVTFENCHIPEESPLLGQAIECSVFNDSDRSVAEIAYRAVIGEEGREIPWLEGKPRHDKINGGINPQERIDYWFTGSSISNRANREKLTVQILDFQAFDTEGNLIP